MTATSPADFTSGQRPIPTTCICYFQPLDQYQYQQLPTYPFPNPTLTLTCCQLTVVELGEG